MEKIVSLAKRRGFIFPGSEIYGGLAGTWDYGPLGVELKKSIKNEWWKSMVYGRNDVVGMDAAIIMNPEVWEASGHITGFSDPLMECKKCHQRFRADQMIDAEIWIESGGDPPPEVFQNLSCPNCGEHGQWTEPKMFNLLTEVFLGVTEPKQKAYLRGEITQGVHVNFKNILDSTRISIPFGVAQIGKAFRNEITPGNFTFRSREFEQMELQFYIKPGDKESQKWFEYWKEERMNWYISLGMNKKKLRFRQHAADERAHYAQDAWDIEYESPFGWKEFEGIHNRGDWDLSQHQKYSGVDMGYLDPETSERYLPWIIETSGGVDRAALFFLIDAYHEEKERVILKLNSKLAPYKAAIFPLLANKPDLVELAKKIYDDLRKDFMVAWDDRGNIGKRYYSQDEIGTPFCITVDFDSLEKNDATVRDRDTTKQDRIKIEKLAEYLKEKLASPF